LPEQIYGIAAVPNGEVQNGDVQNDRVVVAGLKGNLEVKTHAKKTEK
jgi:hypothetical protein